MSKKNLEKLHLKICLIQYWCFSSDNMNDYNRRINILKSLIANDSGSKTVSPKEISDTESVEEIPTKNVSTRDELLGTESEFITIFL